MTFLVSESSSALAVASWRSIAFSLWEARSEARSRYTFRPPIRIALSA